MLAQIELTNEMTFQQVLAADKYNSIVAAAATYNFSDDCAATYLATRIEREIGGSIELINSYIEAATAAAEAVEDAAWDMMDMLVNDEGMSWVTFENCYNAILEAGIDGAYSIVGGM